MDNKIKRIWFMEGFSSQRDIIVAVKEFIREQNLTIEIFASHREYRNEILSVADFAFIEPTEEHQRLPFIINILAQYHIDVMYIVKNAIWFEQHRTQIEAMGVKLITGGSDIDLLKCSNNKMDFALFMQQHQLPVVPSILIENLEQLQQHIDNPPYDSLCIKPVHGIYGMGFWRFDDKVSAAKIFSHPEQRVVKPSVYLQLYAASDTFPPMVLMPYLHSPEHSVDMVVNRGEVICAIAREKHGSKQYLKNSGPAYELACRCANIMQADGLVNVQTRMNKSGHPLLLEINMRPSGGVGYTQYSGVNLAGLMVFFHLNILNQAQIQTYCQQHFKTTEVISTTSVTEYPENLSNLITISL